MYDKETSKSTGEFKEIPVKPEELEQFINDAICEKLNRDYKEKDLTTQMFFITKIELNIEANCWLSCKLEGNINLFCDGGKFPL